MEADSGKIIEHRLGNGLLVLLRQNRVAPVVSLSFAYRVGSRYERPGMTGVSHLLEHEMFKGTHKHPTGDFDRLLTSIGADNNAYTWMDRTVYYEVVPADRIDLVLELEADRMRNLVFDEREHASELAVVRNELEQSDDSPPTLLFKNLRATAFIAHPYGIPTIGWTRDLERITVEQVRSYYDRYYRPENAVIVAVGEFDPDMMLAAIERHFAAIPRGKSVDLRVPSEPEQTGQRRLVLRRSGRNDYILIGWHTPASRHQDAYALEVLENVLGNGRTSRLYQRLVETGKAGMVSASSSCFAYCDPFLFLASAALNEETTPEDAEKLIFEEIDRIISEGVTEKELARAKKQARAGFIYGRDSAESEADTILTFETASSYKNIDRYLPGIQAVTDDDVRRVAGRYFGAANSTVGYYLGVRSGGSPVPELEDPAIRIAEPPHRSAWAPGDSAMGVNSAGNTPIRAEDVAQRRMPNGMLVLVKESRHNDTVAISGRIRCGSVFEPKGKAGLAHLTAQLLSEGTKTRTKLQIAELLEDNAMSLSFQAEREYVSFGGRCLPEDLEKLIGLLAEELQQPAFPEKQLELVRAQTLSAISRMEDDTFQHAFRTGQARMYGRDHPYGSPVIGWSDTVKALARSDIVDFYNRYVTPAGFILSVVGNVDTEEAVALVSGQLGGWCGDVAEDTSLYARSEETYELKGERVELDMPGRSNATVLIMRPGINRLAPDYYAASVANYIFGGDFASRLNEKLRTVEGLTYGSYSFASARRGRGPWVIYIQTNPANVKRATEMALAEWRRMYEEGVTEDELSGAKSYLTGNFAVRLSNIGAIAGALAEIAHYDLGMDYFERYQHIINGLTRKEVNLGFRDNFGPDNYITVTAGDFDNLARL